MEKPNTDFKLNQNMIFVILIGIGAWYFTKIDQKGDTTQTTQTSLMIDVKTLGSSMVRMERQLDDLDKKIEVTSVKRWTIDDHNRYQEHQLNLDTNQDLRIKYLEDQNKEMIKTLAEIKEAINKL